MLSADAPIADGRLGTGMPPADAAASADAVRPSDSINRQSLFSNVVPFPVLLVEDKDSLRAMLRLALEGQGHAVIEARDESEARARLADTRPAVVLTDLKLPDGDGFGVLRAAKDVDSELQVIVMTAYASIQDAVTAMKEGAMDFLAKPIDPEHLLLLVERALAQRRLLTENVLLKEELAERRGAPRIVGEHPQLKRVSQQLHRAAATDATVLLEGESGTGKELFARALHALSDRADGPFVAVNCAAIPETLLETELFGYEKGAFTGAAMRKPGRFEVAHRGTLLLDEIGDLSLPLQAKILRALEEKQFERVGGTQTLRVDVRVVAATHRNLKQRVADRQFREDLFFRLSVFPIRIPALRERGGDVVILANHFVEKFARELNKPRLKLSHGAIEALRVYPWPGNVRELQNCIERAAILSEEDVIHERTLSLVAPVTVADPPPSPWDQIDLSGTLPEALRRATSEIERRKLVQALKDAGGQKTRAAELLDLNYKVLLHKLREYKLGE
jgi:DNA-binding NtrC family response regulator